MTKYPRNALTTQIIDAGYCFNAMFFPSGISIFMHPYNDTNHEVILHERFNSMGKAVNAMLDKIAELGISGKYLTKEMIKDE